MGKITIQGDNSPAGILKHWERKTKTDCAREILRCWTERDTLCQQLEQAEARVAELERDVFEACAQVLDKEAEAVIKTQGLGRKMTAIRLSTIAQSLRTQADELENPND